MKKNTITKVLIALVMVALVCALCACGGGGGGGGGGGTEKEKTTTEATQLKTPTLSCSSGTVTWAKIDNANSYEYVIISADGEEGATQTTTNTKRSVIIQENETIKVRAIPKDTTKYSSSEWARKTFLPGVAKQVVSLVNGVEGYVSVLNSVQVTDTLSADVSVGGYFTTNDKTNTADIAVKANASKNAPSFMVDFNLNGDSYVSLGFKNNAILVREPINFINTDDEEANAFAINIAALDPTIDVLSEMLMEIIEANADKISLDGTAEMINDLLSTLPINLDELLALDKEGDAIVIGVNVGLLGLVPTLLPTLTGKTEAEIETMVDGYIDTANEVLGYIGKDELALGGQKLTYASLVGFVNNEAIADNSILKIYVTYTGDALTGVALELDLGALGLEGVDYKAGLTVGLNSFSKERAVAINTNAFTAQDLVISLDGALPQKELSADVKAVLRLSDGLAAAGNKIATVTVDGEGKNGATGSAYGYITDSGAYVDFTGIFNLLGVQGNYKYKQELEFSVIEMINELMTAEEEEEEEEVGPANGAMDALDGVEVGGFNVGEIVQGVIAAGDDWLDYICGFVYNDIIAKYDDGVEAKEGAGQADIIEWVFNLELGDTGSYVYQYVKFYDQQATFEALLDSIVAIHEANASILEEATNTTAVTAGVQLLSDDNTPGLLDYVAKFVKIPSITEGAVDFQALKEVNDKDALNDWLDWIFPANNEYRVLVESILGIGLSDIINDGVYFEAENRGGLSGAVLAASSAAKTEVYVSLGAGIGMKATTSFNKADITGAIDFTTETDGKLNIATDMTALFDALIEY